MWRALSLGMTNKKPSSYYLSEKARFTLSSVARIYGTTASAIVERMATDGSSASLAALAIYRERVATIDAASPNGERSPESNRHE